MAALNQLRVWRKGLKKTQEELAREIGENSKTYSSYERGASPMPPEILLKLRALGYEGIQDQRYAETSLSVLTKEDLQAAVVDLRAYIDSRISDLEHAIIHKKGRVSGLEGRSH